MPENNDTSPNETPQEAASAPEGESVKESKEPKAVPASDSGIPRIRTYKEDIAEAVGSQKASLTSIAAAEAQRRAKRPLSAGVKARQVDWKKIGVISGSALLIGLSIGIFVYFLLFYQKEESPVQEEIQSIIFAERQKRIDITDSSARRVIQQLTEERSLSALSLGQIKHLHLTTTDTRTGTTHTLTTSEFFNAIGAGVDDAFLRSLDQDFMVGIHSFDRNQPFMIFTSNSYQHSFAGMLTWERVMYQDLFPFMGKDIDPANGRAVNPRTGEEIILKPAFEDIIVQNIDARALVSEGGTTQLLYAFPNQQTLIITTNENTLIEIVTRLRNVRVF